MGLILCGALFIAFYIAKIFFPEFIIGIAETPGIVKLGITIQSNKWYLHLFNFSVSYLLGYVLCCACCRVYRLNKRGNLVFGISSILLRVIAEFYPEHYTTFNYINIVFTPFLICLINKRLNKDTFISTLVCFVFDLLAQVLSLLIRDLPAMSTNPNVVTILILLIDMLIWRVMLYLFFNYKTKKENNENGN